MPLSKADHIIQSLKERDEAISFENVTCWEFKEESYSLYMFSIQLKDQDELLAKHEGIRDYIAIYFQSQSLEKDIERWNIYQFFFIEEKIDDATKQKVEQDKFSTRKIIHDDQQKELSDDDVKALINQELFDLKFEKRQMTNDSIDLFLNKDHSSVLALIDQLDISNLDESSIIQIVTSLSNE